MKILYLKNERSVTAEEALDSVQEYFRHNGSNGLVGIRPDEDDVEETRKVADYLGALSRQERGLAKVSDVEKERARVEQELRSNIN